MAKILVPTETQLGFRALADLSDEDHERLVETARALTAEHVAAGLDEALNSVWPDAPSPVREAFWAASSLQTGPVETDEPLREFISDFTGSLFALPSFSGLSQEKFRERLEPFLDMPAFSLGVRIGNVMYDNQRNFVQARTLTDLRPIFSSDETYDIERAVIVHNLKITYNESGSRADFFITLDDNDVKSLMAVLQRAQKKAASIDTFLKHMSDSED